MLDTLCKSIVKEKQPFERLEMKKEDLLEMFKVPFQTLPQRTIGLHFDSSL